MAVSPNYTIRLRSRCPTPPTGHLCLSSVQAIAPNSPGMILFSDVRLEDCADTTDTGGLSKETTVPAEPKAIRRGKSSNIFTGRAAILRRLDEYFGPRAPGDTSRREFHLRGMGGVGKTQIALKFTERNERMYFKSASAPGS